MLALTLIILGVLLRFVPHAPNFTPVAAIALFSGAYLSRKRALTVALLIMMASDLFIGAHDIMLFTWGSFVVIAIMGSWLKKMNWLKTISMSLVSSLVFYVISNFGVWVMGWYPHTLKGLIDCYIMALPFLRNFTLSTMIYSVALFGAFEIISRLVRNTKLSTVLLTNF